MADQRFSCTSLWPGLCLILGGAIGWFRGGWIGLLIGAPTGLAVGLLSILILGLAALTFAKRDERKKPPVD